jgi:hypothetical protein
VIVLLVDFANLTLRNHRSASPYALVRRAILRTRDAAVKVGATHIVFAFDDEHLSPAFRGRPDEGRQALARQLLEGLGYPCVALAGVSADDLLLSLRDQALAQGADRVVILSNDHDLWVSIAPHCDLCTFHATHGLRLWGADCFQRKFGITPAQTGDLVALGARFTPDRHGVAVVDGRTARQLLARYSSLDRLYAQIDTVDPPALRARLGLMEAAARERQRCFRARYTHPCALDLGCTAVSATQIDAGLRGLEVTTVLAASGLA